MTDSPARSDTTPVNRRGFMDNMACGLSGIALSSLLAGDRLRGQPLHAAETSTVSGTSPIRPTSTHPVRLPLAIRTFRRERRTLS
jgi:hypothetical protein